MPDTLEGGCACGRARFRLASKPMFVNCCHCRDCQRQTGSAFVINALIEANRVEMLSGETEAVVVPTDSGRPHIIHRCPDCKVALWSHYGGRREVSFIRVGTLDDASWFRPEADIFMRSAQPWDHDETGVPKFDGYPPGRSYPLVIGP